MPVTSENCPHGGAPTINADISGIGVRISFYLQTIFLAFLTARCKKRLADDIEGALYTLMATNIALIVTSLILGLKPEPQISLQDALVVFYMLILSWAAIFFSLPTYHRLVVSNHALKALSIFQSYLFFAFALVLLFTHETFGSAPECNANAKLVLFRPFSAVAFARVAGWVIVVGIMIIYTVLIFGDYLPVIRKKWRLCLRRKLEDMRDYLPKDGEIQFDVERQTRQRGKRRHHRINGRFVFAMIIVVVPWSMTVINTELLIKWSRFEKDSGNPAWQFGQVSPMFLLILPLANVLKAYCSYSRRRSMPGRTGKADLPSGGTGVEERDEDSSTLNAEDLECSDCQPKPEDGEDVKILIEETESK